MLDIAGNLVILNVHVVIFHARSIPEILIIFIHHISVTQVFDQDVVPTARVQFT